MKTNHFLIYKFLQFLFALAVTFEEFSPSSVDQGHGSKNGREIVFNIEWLPPAMSFVETLIFSYMWRYPRFTFQNPRTRKIQD